MKSQINLLDVVALTEDLPERNLYRGQIGTIVEFLAESVFEVEFSDNDGCTYESLALKTEQLMVLHFAMSSNNTVENVPFNETNPTMQVGNIGGTNNNVEDNTFTQTNTTITQSSSEVDIKAAIAAINKILRNIESPDQLKIDNALTEINHELEKTEPDKNDIGQAMQRILKGAKQAPIFVKYVEQLKPHVFNVLAWCGDTASNLFN